MWQVTHFRPLQPKVQFDVADDAHGVLITGLQSNDVANVDPVYARPIVDNVAAELRRPPFGDVVFPGEISVRWSRSRPSTGRRVSAVLVHGQFFSNTTADAAGDGTQRLFTRVDADVLRSPSTDRLAPQLDNIDATLLAANDLVAFSVDAVDLPTTPPATSCECWSPGGTTRRRPGVSSISRTARAPSGAGRPRRPATASSSSSRPSTGPATSPCRPTRDCCTSARRRTRHRHRCRADRHAAGRRHPDVRLVHAGRQARRRRRRWHRGHGRGGRRPVPSPSPARSRCPATAFTSSMSAARMATRRRSSCPSTRKRRPWRSTNPARASLSAAASHSRSAALTPPLASRRASRRSTARRGRLGSSCPPSPICSTHTVAVTATDRVGKTTTQTFT